MDLNGILAFVNVVKAGSFTAASRVLGVPVSTVSDRVASLERSLGVTLLTRTTRAIKLTEVGAEFFARSDAAVQQLLEAGSDASRTQSTPTGTLRITSPADFASAEIAEAIAEYRSLFPGVRVEAHVSNRLVDLVAEGFDIAIRGGLLRDSSLLARRIGTGRLILVASQRYLSRAPVLTHPRDLARHTCIGFMSDEKEKEEATWHLRSTGGASVRLKPSLAASSTSFPVLIDLARAGTGVSFLPQYMVRGPIERRELVQVLPMWSTADMPMHLVYPAHRFASLKVKAMLPLLEQRLRAILAAG